MKPSSIKTVRIYSQLFRTKFALRTILYSIQPTYVTCLCRIVSYYSVRMNKHYDRLLTSLLTSFNLISVCKSLTSMRYSEFSFHFIYEKKFEMQFLQCQQFIFVSFFCNAIYFIENVLPSYTYFF